MRQRGGDTLLPSWTAGAGGAGLAAEGGGRARSVSWKAWIQIPALLLACLGKYPSLL